MLALHFATGSTMLLVLAAEVATTKRPAASGQSCPIKEKAMADTTTNEPKRKAKALRDWIDSAGNPVASGDESKATGFRYVHLPTALALNAKFDPESDVPPSDATFSMAQMPDTVKTMLAIFGGLTLAGNIASTETNPKSGGDESANPIPAILAR